MSQADGSAGRLTELVDLEACTGRWPRMWRCSPARAAVPVPRALRDSGLWGAVKNRVTRHNPGVFLQLSAALAGTLNR